ncbi:hypothetical protein FSP39_021526 [Pinctada imbricata]|uniref:Uncharacterized protein n=1 Tax=Pinctada imbricata TaxID=66713 RepID=A0AA89C1W7_PINIB|nr:hypothetical protein FSP39_021526 [Pinctada imbricata]
MSKCTEKDDDSSLENGDLGLGLGLKPGSLPLLNVSDIGQQDYKNYPDVNSTPLIPPAQSKFSALRKLKRQGNITLDIKTKESIGSKILKDKVMNVEKSVVSDDKSRTRRQHTISERVEKKRSDSESCMTKEGIERKLAEAEQEVEELKAEIEVYQRRLDSKYKAIAILKQQVSDIESSFDEDDKRNREYEESLQHEVNTLTFELEKRESSYENSQEKWASRFDSMCKENACLSSLLEKRTEETRNLIARTTALSRERDELLALLDVQERNRYLRSRSVSSDEAYCDYTSTELAVLGACKCRLTNPEPCGCAHAAANMKKEIYRIKQECDTVKKRKEEAYHAIDAYRAAFEEQLQKNKELMSQVAEIAVAGPTKVQKAKTIIKNLIHMLNDDDYLIEVNKQTYALNGKMSTSQKEDTGHVMTDRELVLALTQILHARNESFAHQKIAAQVLSEKVHNLESQLASVQSEEVFNT